MKCILEKALEKISVDMAATVQIFPDYKKIILEASIPAAKARWKTKTD